MLISIASTLVGNTVETAVWLVDETTDPPTYHPELVRSATARLFHNGHLLYSATGDRYNGTADGSIKFFCLNPSFLKGLSVEVEVEDTSGTAYKGNKQVQVEPVNKALPRNPVYEF